ncbi:MAG: endonuclease/exonuclease/phosphatase family protein [Deltaproteobacteria bacterium]|nr:endonuclease/exonuclease/phosphatase family protein [Deltaproteobacteria bacterium]MDQ3295130.1 endonuclease/exonuclease/phosphatase family protein [Myxococcota bacterium]
MRLKVLSYNIHKCIGGVDRKYDPSRIVDVIRKLDVDILMLQEVDAGVTRSRGDKQCDLLGEELGLPYRTWYPNVNVRGGGQYGNAVLSRYPLIESSNLDLTCRFKKARSALHAVLRVRHDDVDRTIHVFNMHLGLARYERKLQLQMFLDSHPFAHLHHETPIIVGGDLNDVYGGLGDLLAPVGFRGIERRPLTFPAWGPVRALDAIFVRGDLDFMRLARCDTDLATRASDHRPIVAEIRLRPHHHHHDKDHKPPSPRP